MHSAVDSCCIDSEKKESAPSGKRVEENYLAQVLHCKKFHHLLTASVSSDLQGVIHRHRYIMRKGLISCLSYNGFVLRSRTVTRL